MDTEIFRPVCIPSLLSYHHRLKQRRVRTTYATQFPTKLQDIFVGRAETNAVQALCYSEA